MEKLNVLGIPEILEGMYKPQISVCYVSGNENEDIPSHSCKVGIPGKDGMVSYRNMRPLGKDGESTPNAQTTGENSLCFRTSTLPISLLKANDRLKLLVESVPHSQFRRRGH
jgi:hypothetical protein